MDIVNTFDSLYHELLLKLLAKFGILDRVTLGIKKIYDNIKIELISGNNKWLVDPLTGVKQGNDLDPILFIIMMKFLVGLLENKWNKNKIQKINSHYNTKMYNKGDELVRHKNKKIF